MHCPDHGSLHVDVDVTPRAGAVAGPQRDHRPRRRLGAGVQLGLGHRDAHRRAVLVAAEVLHPAHGPAGDVGGAVMRPRAGLPVGRDRGVDEAGVGRGEVVEAQPPLGEVARCERLDQYVGAARELAKRLGPIGALDVEYRAALVEAVGGPEEAAFGVFDADGERPAPARQTALRRLDLDHVGTQVGEHLAAPVEAAFRQVEDAVGSKRR